MANHSSAGDPTKKEECRLGNEREGVQAFSLAATTTEAEEICPLSRRADVSQEYNSKNTRYLIDVGIASVYCV